MQPRRTTALAAALLCAFVTPSHASQAVKLDGAKRTHVTIKANLTDPMLSNDRTIRGDLNPTLEDCTPASCDFTQVVVTGKPDGRFKATLTMTRDLNGAIGLYDSHGNRAGEADLTNSCCNDGPFSFNESLTEWKVTFVAPRLRAGTYTLVIWDRGGIGEYVADLTYKVNPPVRQANKS